MFYNKIKCIFYCLPIKCMLLTFEILLSHFGFNEAYRVTGLRISLNPPKASGPMCTFADARFR